MALDFATIAQEPQLAVMAALETTAEAARLALIANHRDSFEAGVVVRSKAAGANVDRSAETAHQLVEQLERLIGTIGRYRAQVLESDYTLPF